MSYQFPAFTDPTSTGDGSSSSINSTLLTPPLTPRSEHDVPYRPTKADKTSLSMKKSRHKTRKAKTSKTSKALKKQDQVLDILSDHSTKMATSVAGRRRSLAIPHRGQTFFQPADDVAETSRRWTLPSKSAPTRVLTPLGSTVKQFGTSNETESPAMITLRRASTSKRAQRIEMTFFPEPKFGNGTSNLLSYIVSTFSRSDALTTVQRTNGNTVAGRSSSARSASVGSDGAHPATTYPAATVCTELFVEPSLGSDPNMMGSIPRRCSTKYVAGDTSLEVIWDENNSSTTTQESSRPSVTSDRRPSVATAKLEAQLASSSLTSRRLSAHTQKSSRTNSQGSEHQFLERVMTPQKLSSLFPRLIHDTALRDLPRSKAGSRGGSVTFDIGSFSQGRRDNRRKSSSRNFDVFPPYSSGQSSNGQGGAAHRSSLKQTAVRSHTRTPSTPTSMTWRTGGMVGSSSHSRRRSSGNILAKMPRVHGQAQHSTRLHNDSLEGPTDVTDMTPLLHKL